MAGVALGAHDVASPDNGHARFSDNGHGFSNNSHAGFPDNGHAHFPNITHTNSNSIELFGFNHINGISSPIASNIGSLDADQHDLFDANQFDLNSIGVSNASCAGDWNTRRCSCLMGRHQDWPTRAVVPGAWSVRTEGKAQLHQPICSQALRFKFSWHYKMGQSVFFSMVGTRLKNKTTNLGAPVMTEAAKLKAGIPSKKCQAKALSKADQICLLEARLASLEHLDDDAAAVSKEPLFSRDSSPEDVDRLVIGSEAPTEVDTEEYVFVGGKRIPLSSYDPRLAGGNVFVAVPERLGHQPFTD
ncbi:hypothetical protein BJ322DRAFT_1019832 [Thelephora terrestris]|uniref:Uncharacterized protein n=1 Tax=Thelephora terrestris TaxID=56493 RepID=A0A9P6L8Q7_9AGAM|nr:hypothetical protein BJ322DRAFT_1019832 [Thelephora terrestris]